MTISKGQNKTSLPLDPQEKNSEKHLLVEETPAGDAMRPIWAEFTDQLRQFITRRVRDENEVEDILQDVFLKIHAKLPQLRHQDRLHAWVYQITRNAITDYYRHQGKNNYRRYFAGGKKLWLFCKRFYYVAIIHLLVT